MPASEDKIKVETDKSGAIREFSGGSSKEYGGIGT